MPCHGIGAQIQFHLSKHWPISPQTAKLLANVFAAAWFSSVALMDHWTQDSNQPPCASTLLIKGANQQSTAPPEVDRDSLPQNDGSMWHIWLLIQCGQMEDSKGKKKKYVELPVMCPQSLYLTAIKGKGRQRECDDTLWKKYVAHKGRREWTRDRAANRTILYRAKYIYRATVSVPLY